MKIASKQKTVIDAVLTTFRVRNDVCCLENWAGVLAGHGASTAIGVTDCETKQSLPKPRLYFDRGSITRRRLFDSLNIPVMVASLRAIKTLA